MDPSKNNAPLKFNMSKTMQAPVTVSDVTEGDVTSSTSQNVMPAMDNTINPHQQGDMMGMFNMMGPMIGPMPEVPNMMMMGPMDFNNFGGMMGPGTMGAMGGMGPFGPGMMGQFPPGMIGQPILKREIIRLKNCTLHPPPPGAPPRSTREKPPGCRTIFIGGIPDKTTEELLFEIFESCGPIQSIRISKKNFAHLRFELMDSVDRAIFISGYRLKIQDSDEKEDTGRIHVDFAQARDDQHEFECYQRAYAREMRHFQRMEQDRLRPPSPPPITHFSDHEASLLLENLKSDDSFSKASQTLVTWLERGECNRRTSTNFYSMVQNVQSHVRRLNNEKTSLKEELEAFKSLYEHKVQDIAAQLCQVERVLAAAHKQKCWDHFTKAQRKNIDTWQRQAQELRGSEEHLAIKPDNITVHDMDLSSEDDDDDNEENSAPSTSKKIKIGALFDTDSSEINKLKEENDSLKCQMEAFKNEVDMVRQEGLILVEEKEKQIKALQNAFQGMQQQLISQRATLSKLESENQELRSKLGEGKETTVAADNTVSNKDEISVTSSGLSVTEKEARMIGLICCFLHVHPHGATVEYLWSYLRQILTVRVREVEDLLEKIPSLFQQEVIGVGAGIERRWTYVGLNKENSAVPFIKTLDSDAQSGS